MHAKTASMLALVPVLMLGRPGLGYRRKAGEDEAPLSPALAGVGQFLGWASTHCSDCSLTLGSLFSGIDGAGFMESSAWQDDTLTVTLTEDNLYGEIAAPSKVPIMWALDKTITMKFATEEATGEATASVEGLGTRPAPQGLDIYEAAMKYSKLDPTEPCGDIACVDTEVEAAGKYLYKKWSTIKGQDGKISRVMRNMYDNNAAYLAVRAQGSGKWGQIFYTVLMQGANRINSLVFRDGTVYATHAPLPFARYESFHGPTKMKMFGQKMMTGNAGSNQAIAEKFARSTVNFGLMMGYGNNRKFYEERGIAPAKVDAIANLFGWCEGTAAGELPTCTGSTPGRVGWAPSPKP
mmetsp:Transcript_5120/g.14422  ORF Transcript_5120/g.14422 Transcript_5120/m.14422 type:complete len:351 (-) Transcript_5120:87-1139(-)